MLSNTIVLPLFDYCSPVWDSCGVGSKAYVDKLNRRAACIIKGLSIGVEELKSTFGWPSRQARRNCIKCVLVHKCLHGIAPSYLLAEFRHAHLFHGDNTGSRYLLRPPFAKNTKYQGSFRITGARTYNTLPRIIRQVETLREFKSAILNSNACSTCCLCNLINCLVLMSLFLCCVRAPPH